MELVLLGSQQSYEAARKACGVGGSCEVIIKRLKEEWKRNAQVT